MPNIVLRPYTGASAYRRIAAVAWDHPRDPHVYGSMEIRCEKLEAWLAAKRQETGEKITVTHAVARALAMTIAKHPDLNALVRLGNLYRRQDIDVFVQVVVEDEEHIGRADLSGVKIKNCERLDVTAICRLLRERAGKIRAGQDAEFEHTKATMSRMPGFLVRAVLRLLEWLQYTLNVDTRFLGAPGDPFGSAMVTNVGVFGLTLAWAPFFPAARTPIIVTLGTTESKPVVEDGEIRVGRVLHLNGTFDHRVVDGYHAGVVAREMRRLLEEPERLDQPERVGAAAG